MSVGLSPSQVKPLKLKIKIPGGTDLERGYGDVRPWRPPFHASPAARKGPISSKRVSSPDPLLRKFGNFSLYSLNFHPNFSSQSPKIWKFSELTSPQIWQFSAHKPPFSEANVSSQAPHFGNPGRTPLPEKSWVPPPGLKSVFWNTYCPSCKMWREPTSVQNMMSVKNVTTNWSALCSYIWGLLVRKWFWLCQYEKPLLC